MNKSVDIIIPVYDTADKLLSNSIKSALSQSHDNIQIIIIDDGSESRTTIKTIEGFKNNPKVTVLKQKNSGVSSARNLGLANSTADYIFFLDSDDTIETEYIERLLMVAKQRKADVVFSGKINSDTHKNDAIFKNKAININDNLKDIIVSNQAFTSCAVLIKGSIARKYRFDTGLAMGEDTIYIMNALKTASSCFYEGSGGYLYNKHQDNSSACKDEKSMKKYLDDSLTMAKIFAKKYQAPDEVIQLFCNKKITTILSNGLKHKNLKNTLFCIKTSDIYKTRKHVKNSSIIRENNLSRKNKIIQLFVNNHGVDFLYSINKSRLKR